MNIQELSVGDWVMWKVYNKTYDIQITEIGNTLIKGLNDDIEYGVLLHQLSPIPLTAEILEKNGWIKIYGSTWVLGAYRMRHIAKSLFIIYATDNEVDFSLYVTAVHELQRAYKFAGLEKEIVL